ncbi:MAG: hypothetical protein IJD40_15810 [Lachnospiraceae bacterium]|nr:hypothetical protein [Lachnospiraceae bacterium]
MPHWCLSRRGKAENKYEKRQYQVTIERISVYPQCYGAVADRLYLFPQKQLVVDIGSWTVDIMPIINRSPDESVCNTQPHGIITCIKEINKECVKQHTKTPKSMTVKVPKKKFKEYKSMFIKRGVNKKAKFRKS